MTTTSPMEAKPQRRKKKAAAHFSMLVLLFVPLYRGLQWRTVVEIVNATSPTPLSSVVQERQVFTSNVTTAIDTKALLDDSPLPPPQEEERDDDDSNTSFSPDNLALPKRIPCGKEKCFFRLKTDNEIAYLVSRFEDREDRRERFQTLEAGWQLATSLESEFQISHFLVAPPKQIIISKSLEARMNTNLWSEKYEKKTYRSNSKKRFTRGARAYIQKVRVAPSKPLLVGCAPSKLEPFHKHVKAFMNAIKYPQSFSQNIKRDFAVTRDILKKEPCLIKDFQIMLDTKGNVFHLDFDRCFAPNDASVKYEMSKEETDTCLQVLDDVERQLLNVESSSTVAGVVSLNVTSDK